GPGGRAALPGGTAPRGGPGERFPRTVVGDAGGAAPPLAFGSRHGNRWQRGWSSDLHRGGRFGFERARLLRRMIALRALLMLGSTTRAKTGARLRPSRPST